MPKLFTLGNPGRPKGSRNKLGEDFFKALSEDFATHGVEVIARVREDDPAVYMQTVAKLMPRELKVERPLTEMSDAELAELVDSVREALVPASGTGSRAAAPERAEQARAVRPVH